MSELYELGVAEAGELLAKKEVSSVELTQAIIDRCRAKNPEIGAYLTFDEEGALADAKAADEVRAACPEPDYALLGIQSRRDDQTDRQ